jgi:hypothetical protein
MTLDDILGGIGAISDTAKDVNGTYQEIKNGSNNPQSAEQYAQQNTGVNASNWSQPAVIVGIAALAVAIIGLWIKR